MAKVSIVIPIFRVDEIFLEQCIMSVCKQTLKDIEVILVDDGMSEGCKKICEKFTGEDHRVTLLVQKNQGVSVARNNGLAHATAPIITFVDSDDWVEPEMCEKIVDEFQKQKEMDILIFAAYLNNSSGERKNPFWNSKRKVFRGKEKEQVQLQSIYKSASDFTPDFATFGTTWCKAYSREWLLQNHLHYEPELRRGQDTVFNLYAFEKADAIVYVEEYLYHYRLNEDSAIHRYTDDALEYLSRILKHIMLFINKYEKSEKFYQAYYRKGVSLFLTALSNDYLHVNNPKPLLKRIGELKKALNDDMYMEIFHKVDMTKVPLRTRILWTCIKEKRVLLIIMIHKIYSMFVK